MKNFEIYKSSAGSGKTAALVKSYLKIALATENTFIFKSILAITFTNKAASEMKERILKYLALLSSTAPLEKKDAHVAEYLIEKLKITQAELQKRALNTLQAILHSYGDFSVLTLDSFVYRLIKSFQFELEIPSNLNINLNKSIFISLAVDEFFRNLGDSKNKKELEKVLKFAFIRLFREENVDINRLIKEFYENLLSQKNLGYIRLLEKYGIDESKINAHTILLEKETQELTNKLIEITEGFNNLIKTVGILSDSFTSKYNLPKLFSRLRKSEKSVFSEKFRDNYLEKSWYRKDTPQAQKDLIDKSENQIKKLITDAIEKEEDWVVKSNMLKTHKYYLSFFIQFLALLNKVKLTDAIYAISDFKNMITRIVQSEPIPFIYSKVGQRYKHFLIDEYQDTSLVDWHNLVPLIENGLSEGNTSIVVGDPKQSIYSFNGGEVEQIISLPKIYKSSENSFIKEREEVFERNSKVFELKQNFRSKKEIVEFNNSFFKQCKASLPENYNKVYDDCKQEVDSNNTGGFVEVKFFERKSNKEQLIEEKNKEIVVQIRKLKEAGYKLSDIAVILARNAAAQSTARYFSENNVNFISSETLRLKNSTKVKFLINLIGYITEIAVKYSEQSLLFQFNRLSKNKFQKDLEEQLSFENFLKKNELSLNKDKLKIYSVFELVTYLVNHFTLEEDGPDIYIQNFLQLIQNYTAQKNNVSLHGFIDYWNELDLEKLFITIPEGIGAVTITTIHKAKGLAFPVVIHPIDIYSGKSNDLFFETSKYYEFPVGVLKKSIMKEFPENELYKERFLAEESKNKLEQINLTYVAFTRPIKALFILGDYKTTKAGSTIYEAINKELYNYCESFPERKIGEDRYRFGKVTPFIRENEKKQQTELLDQILKPKSWREKIKVSYKAPLVWSEHNPTSEKDMGTLTHQILSKSTGLKSAKKLIEVHKIEGTISYNEAESITKELENIFAIPLVENWFSAKSTLSERPILSKENKIHIPDKVVFTNDFVDIIDFKTGQKENKHKIQLEKYKDLLEQMGHENIRLFLVYTKHNQVEQLV